MSRRTFAFVLNTAVATERTTTALRLAQRLVARGHRVAVFAHDHAAALSAGDGEVPRAVAALLRRGVVPGTFAWVVEQDAARAVGVEDSQVAGVVLGDHADLWGFVREADVVLSVGAAG